MERDAFYNCCSLTGDVEIAGQLLPVSERRHFLAARGFTGELAIPGQDHRNNPWCFFTEWSGVTSLTFGEECEVQFIRITHDFGACVL